MVNPGAPIVQSFRERRAATVVAQYVACAWTQEVAPQSAPYSYRTVPNGSAELVWTAGSSLRVVGPQTGPTERRLGAGTTMVGLRLRPGVVPAVFGVPASELVDLELPADEVWGATSRALEDALDGAGDTATAARVLEQDVAARLREGRDIDRLAAEAARRLSPGRAIDVGALAPSLFISERQLRRRCEAAIGLAPKVLQRMLRFQRFLALATTLEQPSDQIARLAAEAGYADQSHLTREAIRLDGRPPRVLLREAEQQCACSHDHAASYQPLLQPS